MKRTGALALKTHRLALASLANHPAVRAIKPVGYTDPRPAWIDPDALREAARSGSAEVLVQLRSPFVGGQLSPSTYQAQMQSNQRMLDELLAPYKPLRKPQSFALLGAASAVLSQPDLERLATNRDARLQGLLVNKPMYKPSLATSTATMNLPPYWSSGYTGAGQTIVIVDTGIEKAHAMLKSAGGTSRVTFEACYQTDTVLDGKTYHSDCPGKNTHGDSPPGLTGSGEPIAESLCLAIGGALLRDVYCNHGTHVGGIAAGRYSALMSPSLQGVAPDSSIASINIASRHTDNFSIFPVDLIAVLDTLSNAITATPGNSPFVINMSLGGMPQSAPSGLNGDALNTFGNAVTALKTAAVPVVAAMGNLGLTYEMDLPAAVQGVIKVGAVENDGAGLTISPFSNRVQPAYWGGEYIFFAPGGTDYVHGILSAKAYTAAKNGSYVIPGTSMAAPHVSGLYSLLKAAFPAATQDQHSNFIRDFLSENFSGYACNPSGVSCGSTPFKPIKMP